MRYFLKLDKEIYQELNPIWDRDTVNGYTYLKNSSDNVGIGTSSPSAKLHIQGDGTEYARFSIGTSITRTSIGSIGGEAGIWFGGTSDARFRLVGGKDLEFTAQIDDTSDIIFRYRGASIWNNYNGVLQTERMRITNAGNVGIGTDSPAYQLDITKDFNLTNTTHSNQYGIIYKNGTRFIHDFNYGDNGTVTTDGNNLFIGKNAGNLTMGATATSAFHASKNIGIGNYTLGALTTGYYNTILGFSAGSNITTGGDNALIGYQAGLSINEGNSNIAIGRDALVYNTTGSYNVVLGKSAQVGIVSNSVSSVIAIGYLASRYNTADNIVAIGRESLKVNTGNYNTAIGYQSLISNTSGSANTAQGYHSLYFNTTGYRNTAQGYNAGRYITGGSTANETSNTSIYLGANTKAKADGDTNEIVIGYSTTGNGSNTVTLGNDSITETHLKGKLYLNDLNTAPSSASDTGTKGEIRVTASAIYICTATDTWVKCDLAT